MTLADLEPGMSGTIIEVDAAHAGVVRLMVLGLVEGTRVNVCNAAIGGDPIEVRVMGSSVSVRREQARHFTMDAD